MKLKICIFLFIMITTRTVFSQDIIPADRRIDWDPGIPGGIPDYPVGVNVMDYGAAGDGITDDFQAFMDAIDACPEQNAVFIPSGTYLISGRVDIRKSVALRGAGPDATFLKFEKQPGALEHQRTNIWIGQRLLGFSSLVTNGCIKGSYQITVDDASGFAINDLVEIRQDNDESIMARPIVPPSENDSWAEDHWGWRAVGQFLLITDIDESSNILTFHHPLYFNYNLFMNPELTKRLNTTWNAGVEDLHIELVVDANGYYGNIHLDGSVYCWVKNVRGYKCSRSHIGIWGGLGNEIRECYFEYSHGYAGGQGYAVNLIDRASDNLIENNIFDYLQGKMMTAVGVCGNVYAYNYGRVTLDDLGDYEDMHADLSAHGHHANMNLFEGNSCNRAHVDTYWGSNANYIFLRNKMLCPDGYIRSSVPVGIEKNNPEMTFIANVLHHENSLEDRIVWVFPDDPDDFSDPDLTMSTLICHGNYDYMSENVQWDPDIENHDIPDSYYLDSKPDFFTNAPWGDTPWPNIGPDLLHARILPAQQRFCDLNGITPPSPPSGLSAVALNNQITLNWSDNSHDEQGFRIEQSMDGNHFSRIAVTMADSSHYTVTGLTPWTTYTYRVCSFNDIPGNSVYSNTASATTQEAVPLELTAWFPYNGDANDASSNDYHGEVHGAVLSSGHSSQSYSFDGLDDYIESPGWDPDGWGPITSPVHGDNQAFTVTAWINPADADKNNWVLSDNSTWGDFVFGVHDSRPFIRYFCNLIEGGYQRYMLEAVETATVETGVFTHIAASYDPLNNIVRLYLNGQQVAIDRVNHPLGPVSFDHLFVGCGGYSTGVIEYFEGMIDDVRIYASTLSQTQIQSLAETDVKLQIKIFLEGPYHSGTMGTDLQTGGHIPLQSPYDATTLSSIPADVVDWVLVEIRSHADGSGDNYSQSAFVRQDGMVLDINGSEYLSMTAPEGNYYITIRHRNHLSVMSDVPVFLSAN
ncbi:fibronectin type III domain-containing protein [bacterium]|nr:fibronectin type III domain-containing protein [bacterium]